MSRLSIALALAAQTGAAVAILLIIGATIPVWVALSAMGASLLHGFLSKSDRSAFAKNLLVSVALAAVGLDYPDIALPIFTALVLHIFTLFCCTALVRLSEFGSRAVGSSVIVICVVAGLAGFSLAAAPIFPKLRDVVRTFGPGAVLPLVIKPTQSSKLVPLEIGPGVGWVSKGGLGSGPCALVLHGANSLGSLQAAAQTLIVALHRSGYRVLALDHMGYGKSSYPAGDSLEDWNPGAMTDSGMQYLQSSDCANTIVVAHSMGVTQALRLTRRTTFDFDAAFLFGGGLHAPIRQDRLEYWHRRFHQDRRLTRSIPFDLWYAIDTQYYHPEAFLEPIAERGAEPDVVFVEFANEHQDLTSTRDQLREMIGQVERVSLPSDHYFNGLNSDEIIYLDARLIRELKRLFEDRRKEAVGGG